VLPLALAAVSFPQWTVWLWGEAHSGSAALACVLAIQVVLSVLLAASPAPNEPDVHDRQLDVILALPLLAAAVWLALGWGALPAPGAAIPNHLVMAVTAFLLGTSFIFLGTRITARLRWILLLPLCGMSGLTGNGRTNGVVVAGVLVVMVVLLLIRERAHQALATQATGHRASWQQTLPRLRVSPAIVVVAAGFLGVGSFRF
jgi:hypothetical protein